MPLKVVLYQPQIPQNTGNIVRTCSVTGASLALVAPLGFSVSDRHLKRAGLDYWEGVDLEIIEDFWAFLSTAPGKVYFFSSKATMGYSDVSYGKDDWLIFGSETVGLPPELFRDYSEKFATIPMKPNARCLNLATSVGIVVYEAWRQLKFV